MKTTTQILMGSLLALGATMASAQVAQVKVWAAACANCHGTNGRAVPGAGMDSLAGENKEKMLQTLADFKSGDKPASIMHQITKGYTDEQLALIADYYAKQK